MIGYATIGTNDLGRAVAFYDALLSEVGAKQLFNTDRIHFFGTALDTGMLAVCTPYDGKAQGIGNGNMVALPGGSREGVDKAEPPHGACGRRPHGGHAARPQDFCGTLLAAVDS